MRTTLVGVLAAAALAFPAAAFAQMQWADRAFINVGAGMQGGSKEVRTATTLRLYDEDFILETSQHAEGGTVIDLSGGYRVWKNLAIGFGYTHAGQVGDLTASAAVPDPLFFDRSRPTTATFAGGGHSQQGIHLMGVWMIPITDKIDVAVSGGPSYFMVKHLVPSGATVEEPTPTLSALTLDEPDASGVGVNVGVDVAYILARAFGARIGAGATFRYTYAKVDIPGTTEKFTAGGPQGTLGLRIRF